MEKTQTTAALSNDELKQELSKVDETIDYLENEIRLQEDVIELGKLYNSMIETEAFNVIIAKGYVQEEADRLAQGLTNPTIRDQRVIDAMHAKLNSIRDFNTYFMEFAGDIAQAPGLIEQYKEDIAQNKIYRAEVTSGAEL